MPGPFSEYVPAGVYTQTIFEVGDVSLPGNIRLPIIYGVADEFITRKGIDLVRGSSAVVDFKTNREDVAVRFFNPSLPMALVANDGQTTTAIKVRNFPIVDGSGKGTTTDDPMLITLTVDGEPWPIDIVDGANGVLYLASLIPAGADVRATYFFSKKDTLVSYTVPAALINGTRKAFFVQDVPIVDGSGAGLISNDATKVVVTVDGTVVPVDTVDGTNGLVTLFTAPALGSVVVIEYYTNSFQDTADVLPDENVESVQMVGLSPGRSDFSLNKDFILSNNSIQWGPSFITQAVVPQVGTELWGESQILSTMVDNKYYGAFLGTGTGTQDEFTLPFQPVEGDGRARVTNDPDLVSVYVGASLAAALLAGPVTLLKVDGTTRKVQLLVPPTAGAKVYATFFYSLLAEDKYTFEVDTVGPSKEISPLSPGKYTITSSKNGQLAEAAVTASVVADPNFAITGLVFPGNTSDLQAIPGYAVAETVTLTFTSATAYTVTSSNVNGSSGTGVLDQTYIDAVTGLRFTLLDSNTATFVTTPYSFAAGDTVTITVTTNAVVKCSSVANNLIPGLRLTVTDSINTAVASEATLQTFKMIGNPEPEIGDTYFVNYTVTKTDYMPKLYTEAGLKNIYADYGDESASNHIAIAARLLFLNGARGVIIKQVQRAPGKTYALARSYIEAIAASKDPLPGGIRPYIHVPLTEDAEVISFLKKYLHTQSTIQKGNNCVGIFGYPINVTPEYAQEFAKKMGSHRMRAIFSPKGGAVYGIVDAYGREKEIVVGGSMLAAAFAGLTLSTQFDEAESFTLKQLVGFKRSLGTLDSVTANLTATAGNTVLEDLKPSLLVRQEFSTDMSSVLAREPYVTSIADMLEEDVKFALRPFIGKRRLGGALNDMTSVVNGVLEVRKSQGKISEYASAEVLEDKNDPTIVHIFVSYRPTFSTGWITVKFSVHT